MEWILLALVGAVLVGAYGWYASLITRRNQAREALSSVDVQLRKRYDLIPNILTLARRFMEHEKDRLERLTALRARVEADYDRTDPDAVKGHIEAAKELDRGLGRLLAVAENYPELRSAETIVTAQQTYQEVEGHIAAARRFYNAAVTQLNNAVEIFPGSVIANVANVRAMPYYEVEEEARAPISADAHLN